MTSKFEELCELTRQLDLLIADGTDETTDKGDKLRDKMDSVWLALTDEEKERFKNDPDFCPRVCS